MIDLLDFSFSEDMEDAIEDIDINDDGQLSQVEINTTDNDDMKELRDMASTNQDFDFLKAYSDAKGYYICDDGTRKSTEPGEGGHFAILKKRKMEVDDLPEEDARKVAASIGWKYKPWLMK